MQRRALGQLWSVWRPLPAEAAFGQRLPWKVANPATSTRVAFGYVNSNNGWSLSRWAPPMPSADCKSMATSQQALPIRPAPYCSGSNSSPAPARFGLGTARRPTRPQLTLPALPAKSRQVRRLLPDLRLAAARAPELCRSGGRWIFSEYCSPFTCEFDRSREAPRSPLLRCSPLLRALFLLVAFQSSQRLPHLRIVVRP